MSPLPKRALISITSNNDPFYPNGDRSGLFYTEAKHPYDVLTKAGFAVDLASETGTFGMDPHSLDEAFMGPEDLKAYNDPNNEFSKRLANIHKASDLLDVEYSVFFASAGHATLFDYPTAKDLIRIAEGVWNRGGIVSAVCHGPAILPPLKDKAGKHIIEGRRVTGFTDKGEIMMGLMDQIKKLGLVGIESSAASVGAIYESPEGPFDSYTVTDGRLVTGTNPASAHATAEKVVEAFNKL